MLNELTKSIRLHLSERLTSPLMGAFLISWCIFNYEIVLVTISNEAPSIKTALIKGYFSSRWDYILRLVTPIGLTLLYIYAYPYPARWTYEYSRKKQKDILEIRRQIEDDILLTEKESRKIKAEISRIKTKHESEVDQYQKNIGALTEQLEEQVSTSKGLYEEVQSLQHQIMDNVRATRPRISGFEIDLLDFLFSNKNDSFTPQQIFSEVKINQAHGISALISLLRKGFIGANFNNNYEVTYSISEDGMTKKASKDRGDASN